MYSLNVFSIFAVLRSSSVETEPLRVAVVKGGLSGVSSGVSSPVSALQTDGDAPVAVLAREKPTAVMSAASPDTALLKPPFRPLPPAS